MIKAVKNIQLLYKKEENVIYLCLLKEIFKALSKNWNIYDIYNDIYCR